MLANIPVTKVVIEQLEVQLSNGIITTGCEIRFGRDEVTLDFATDEGLLSFEFALSGNELRLIARDIQEQVALSNISLFNFFAPNPRLHLTRATGALVGQAPNGAGK